MKKELQLLLKPVSSRCNMRCAYCFYEDEAGHRKIPSYGNMTQDIMEAAVRKALQSADSCVFGFQGGEPLLAGFDFYENFVSMVEKEKRAGQRTAFTIQTNGLLLDERWNRFFREKGFLVGISLDGTRELHDRNRKDAGGRGTYSAVLGNAGRLLRAGVPVNILCVLTRQNARRIRSIYTNLKKQGFLYHQYLPCLNPLGEENGRKLPYALDGETYGEALKELFDLWFEDRVQGNPVYVREMDNWLHVLKGGVPEACAMYGKCTPQNVIEADGSVFPCDFYALDEYYMGNIRECGFEDFREAAALERGFFCGSTRRDFRCGECRYYPLCRGGCRRDLETSGGKTKNRWCEAYREFFPYAIQRFEWLAARELY